MLKINRSLIKGSIILLLTFNIYGLLNFLFQFSMARLLPIKEYGIIVTLFAMIYILGIFSESISTILTKYSTTEKNKGKLKNILHRSLRKAIRISFLAFFVYLIIAIPLGSLLKIPYLALSLNGLMIIASFLLPVTRGIMQGRKMFTKLGINLIAESSIKIILAIALVIFSFKFYGAIIATVISSFIAFIFSYYSLRDIINSKEKQAIVKNIYLYSKPVFFVTAVILIFYNLDVIIARIVFSEDLSSKYAIASILAKVIFWGTQPISKAMFPFTAENKKLGKDKPRNLLVNSLSIVMLCILSILILYYLFPSQIINIFTGKQILESAGVLFSVTLGMALLSLTNLYNIYRLSINKVKGYVYLSIFLIIEGLLLFIFSSSIIQFSIAFICSSAIFLIGSILVYKLNEGRNNNSGTQRRKKNS